MKKKYLLKYSLQELSTFQERSTLQDLSTLKFPLKIDRKIAQPSIHLNEPATGLGLATRIGRLSKKIVQVDSYKYWESVVALRGEEVLASQ